MKLSKEQKKQLDRYRMTCGLLVGKTCMGKPCFCRKEYKEMLKNKDKPFNGFTN